MLKYSLKRIGMAALVLLFVAFITFMLMNTVPGSPFLNEKAASPEVVEALNKKYGLDQPIHIQFVNYIKN